MSNREYGGGTIVVYAQVGQAKASLIYTSDAADEDVSVDHDGSPSMKKETYIILI